MGLHFFSGFLPNMVSYLVFTHQPLILHNQLRLKFVEFNTKKIYVTLVFHVLRFNFQRYNNFNFFFRRK